MTDQPRKRRQPPGKPYGVHAYRTKDERHYLQTCVRPDVWAAIKQLQAEHDLTISGAAHHLMRLGAGLQPLYPFSDSTNG